MDAGSRVGASPELLEKLLEATSPLTNHQRPTLVPQPGEHLPTLGATDSNSPWVGGTLMQEHRSGSQKITPRRAKLPLYPSTVVWRSR